LRALDFGLDINFIKNGEQNKMGKKERQAMRLLGIKRESSESPGAVIQLPPALKMTWYLNTWFEKLIFVLGFFGILYTIGTLLIFGVPWK